MTDVTLTSGGPAATAPARSLKLLSWQPDGRSLSIGAGHAAYVEVHQNANPGWEASLLDQPARE
jgi:arabinofuranan 3-O-arabinosyltransferase